MAVPERPLIQALQRPPSRNPAHQPVHRISLNTPGTFSLSGTGTAWAAMTQTRMRAACS